MARDPYPHEPLGQSSDVDVHDPPHEPGFDEPSYVEPAYAETVTERTTTSYADSLPARVNAVLVALLLALEGLLALRFTLRAFGANPGTAFVDFVYDLSWPFVRPFEGAFADRAWDEGVVEVNTLLAMGVWLLGYALLAMILNALMPRIYTDGGSTHRRRVTHV